MAQGELVGRKRREREERAGVKILALFGPDTTQVTEQKKKKRPINGDGLGAGQREGYMMLVGHLAACPLGSRLDRFTQTSRVQTRTAWRHRAPVITDGATLGAILVWLRTPVRSP